MRKRFRALFHDFVESEKTGGFVLIFNTAVSMILANSIWSEAYLHFWHTPIVFSVGDIIHLDFGLEHWINDGLMAVFFLLVGLEIERELYVGELSSVRNAVLPIVGALGGMLVPALVHFAFNAGTATQGGFAIPMATDIAFALGILSLAGRFVPVSIKIFLTALAIIDDLGAIIVIALFYTSDLQLHYLYASLGIFAGLLVFNRLKVYNLWFYLLPGIAMWYCMLQSGIHATLSGVLLAFAVPFDKHADESEDEDNPSYVLQHVLHKPVAFFIVPLFALANTAIVLPDDLLGSIETPNSLGIIAGLFLGKVAGICLFVWVAVKLGIGKLYSGMNWKNLAGAGFLGGIGFTMSIFITNLAFTDSSLITASKLSILLASLLSAGVGLLLLRFFCKPATYHRQ